MGNFDLTREAAEDLYRIWEYTVDTWSEVQADRYYAVLEEAFFTIASTPLKVGKPYDDIMPGLRALHIRRHMVFYFVQENARVLIVRVLHEKMDYFRHIFYFKP